MDQEREFYTPIYFVSVNYTVAGNNPHAYEVPILKTDQGLSQASLCPPSVSFARERQMEDLDQCSSLPYCTEKE